MTAKTQKTMYLVGIQLAITFFLWVDFALIGAGWSLLGFIPGFIGFMLIDFYAYVKNND